MKNSSRRSSRTLPTKMEAVQEADRREHHAADDEVPDRPASRHPDGDLRQPERQGRGQRREDDPGGGA
jgi:hypothetical protein